MPPSRAKTTAKIVLLAEEDVILRLGIAEHLRGCGFTVLEAAHALEARTILMAGPKIQILFSDAQLAGPESGFALAQWVRRHRPEVKVLLTATTANKIEAAGSLCTHTPNHDVKTLEARIRTMMAERARRARRPASSSAPGRRRKTS